MQRPCLVGEGDPVLLDTFPGCIQLDLCQLQWEGAQVQALGLWWIWVILTTAVEQGAAQLPILQMLERSKNNSITTIMFVSGSNESEYV